jgi:1-acyl-sn-glycerol-3-phosphate acyltransferase
MGQISKQNIYHTIERKKQHFLRRLWGKCCFTLSISFYFQIVKIVFETWQKARKGLLDNFCWSQQSLKVFKAIELHGGIIHIEGLDNIRNTKGPVVFISNHMSTLETFIFPCVILPKDFTFIIKESLLAHPLMGAVLRAVKAIAVTRKNPREDLRTVLIKGVENLAIGRSLLIFPQSTRTFHLDLAKFNTLGIKLAAKARVPVIPIAVKTDFWGTGKFIRDFGPIGKVREVYITIGEPMMIQGNGREKHKEIIQFIRSHLMKWAGLSPIDPSVLET